MKRNQDLNREEEAVLKKNRMDEASSNSRHLKLTHEVQEGVGLDEAGGSLDTFYGCPKNRDNPGHHEKFISVDKLDEQSLGVLPPGSEPYRSVMFNFVKSYLPLVVRIHGHYISEGRPDTWKDGSPYLFSEQKGKRCNTVGTGGVGYVRLFDEDDYERHTKRCDVCKTAGKKIKVWRIGVQTARHVIFDDKEASECDVVFFDHHDDDTDKVTVSGGCDVYANTDKDCCRMYFFTHDESLADRLMTAWREVNSAVRSQLSAPPDVPRDVVRDLARRAVVLSHPHGRKLYLTFGNFCENDDKKSLFYDAKTCSGSSGGCVISLYGSMDYQYVPYWYFTHSGVDDKGVGVSATPLYKF